MTVHFIGAGPGAADLLTIRGLKLLQQCSTVLYAGSLVSGEVIAQSAADANCIDTASMTLDDIISVITAAHNKGQNIARLHSGDPSIYGAIAEQMRRLKVLSIPYSITPGVTAFTAAAAALTKELTLPGVSQTIILTRTAVRTVSMPPGESLTELGRSRSTLIIHLSINNLAAIVRDLIPLYGLHCPIAVVYRVTWPDQLIVCGTLSDIRQKVRAFHLTRTALILVGSVLRSTHFRDSCLYSPQRNRCFL